MVDCQPISHAPVREIYFFKKCNDAFGIEVAIKQVIERFVEMVFDKKKYEHEKHEEIKSKWTSMLKYTMASKEPLDIQVSMKTVVEFHSLSVKIQ